MLHKKCPPSHCIDSALQILKAPNTSSVGAKPLYMGRPHRHTGAQWDGCPTYSEAEYSPEQSYRQDKHQGVPLVRASLPSMSKHTLLTSRLQILSSHQWSHQPFRAYSCQDVRQHTSRRMHTNTHTHTHTHRTYMCSNTCAQVLKHRNRLQMGPGVAWWPGGHIVCAVPSM